MRIGLMGGTFNPVHLGHLRAAEEVREKFKLNIIYFVPCNEPPHKSNIDLIDANIRLQMLKLAIKGTDAFRCSDIEIRRGGKSYSIDTIRHFLERGIKGSQIYFILGNDSFAEIKTWKNYKELIESCNFIIIKRPGYGEFSLKKQLPLDLFKILSYNKKIKCYETRSKKRIFLTEIKGLEVSSSMIRELIRRGKSIRYLVPEDVFNYIKKRKSILTG